MCVYFFFSTYRRRKNTAGNSRLRYLFFSKGLELHSVSSLYLFIYCTFSLFCSADNRVVTTLIAFAYPYFRKCISSDSEVSSFCRWRHSNPGRIPIPFTRQDDLIRENLIAWIIAARRARPWNFICFYPFP